MHRPLVHITPLLIAGLYLGHLLSFPLPATKLIIFAFSVILLVVFFCRRPIFSYTVIALFFPLGLLLSQGGNDHINEAPRNIPDLERNKNIVEGLVVSREDAGEKRRFLIQGEKVLINGRPYDLQGKIMLTVNSGGARVIPGDRIRFFARLKKPENFGNPGGFDRKGYLLNRGVARTAFLMDDVYIAVIGKGSIFWNAVYAVRRSAEAAIDSAVSGEAAGLIKALTLGNKGFIPKEALATFRATGLAHILAISGLHMGIIAFFFYGAFLWLFKRSEKIVLSNMAAKAAAFSSLLPLTVYLFVSGMSTSAIRAYLMVVLFLLSLMLEREKEIWNTISIAALIILCIWPQALFEVSFQLSFAAVAGIVFISPKIEGLLFDKNKHEIHPLLRKTGLLIIVSLAAGISTAPIVARHFMEISTIGLISNLIAVPILGFLVVPLCNVALFLSLISAEAAVWIFKTASLAAACATRLIEGLSLASFSSIMVSPPSFPEIIGYYLFLWAIFAIKKHRAACVLIIVPALLVLSKGMEILAEKSDPALEVTFLSVGQGESTFVRFPKGETLLIDGGGFYDGNFDVGEMIIRPYLLSRGIKEIDYLAMTHPHPDHIKGLLYILKSFAVGKIWTTGEPAASEDHRLFNEIIREKRIKALVMTDRSKNLNIDGVKISFLHPPPYFKGGKDLNAIINNRSMVMRLDYKNISFLLTADLEAEGERRILDQGYDIDADVIKAPHHGSLTSSTPEFVKKVSPRYTVFTVGYANRFGFPRKEVIARYRGVNAEILRTDMNGAITFKTDGNVIHVETFKGRN